MDRFKSFKKDDVFIGIMGVTGAGKSTFISKCCDGLADIVGDGLRSFTHQCESYTFHHGTTTIHLIDTPGFDDTEINDTDVLKDIASWLVLAYDKSVRLSGMIYLHGIHESRMKGSHMANLRMFRKLTGIKNMEAVVLTTSMWDKTPVELGKRREAELISKDEFWREMIQAKSKVMQFQNDKGSATAVIDYLVDKNKRFVLDLQTEMSVEQKDLLDTGAGQELNVEINRQKAKFETKLKHQEADLRQALQDKDTEYAEKLINSQETIRKEMERLASNQKELQVNNEKLLRDKEAELEKTRAQIEKMRTQAAEADKEHAEKVARMTKANEDVAREMEKSREHIEAEAKAFQEKVIDDAAGMVNFMTNFYSSLSAEQEQLRANANAAAREPPPPPYAPQFQQYDRPPYQPAYQPAYQPSPLQQDPNVAAVTGATVGAVLGGSMLASVVAGGAVCVIM